MTAYTYGTSGWEVKAGGSELCLYSLKSKQLSSVWPSLRFFISGFCLTVCIEGNKTTWPVIIIIIIIVIIFIIMYVGTFWYGYVQCMPVGVRTYMQRPKVDANCFLQLLFTLLF